MESFSFLILWLFKQDEGTLYGLHPQGNTTQRQNEHIFKADVENSFYAVYNDVAILR